MDVRKIKGARIGFCESAGPYEIVELGLDVDGYFIHLGEFYFGPEMNEEHERIFHKLEKFANECEKYFDEKKKYIYNKN